MKFPSPSEDQAKIVWTAASALAVAIILVLVSLIFIGMGWVAKQLSAVLLPLAVAAVIAYLLDPVVDFFQRRGIARSWAIILVFFLAVLFQAGMVATVAPRLITQAQALKKDFPKYKEDLRSRIDRLMEDNIFRAESSGIMDMIKVPEMLSGFFKKDSGEPTNPEEVSEAEEPDSGVEVSTEAESTNELVAGEEENVSGADSSDKISVDGDLIEKAWGIIGPVLSQVGQVFVDSVGQIGSLFGLLAGFALVPVYVFYFLAEKKGIQDSWTDYLPIHESKMKEEIVFVIRSINDSLIVFFRSQVLVAMCVGGLLMIGFSIIGLRFGILLGFIAGVLGIVPYLGVMLSIVPAVIIAIIQSNGILFPFLTLGVFVVVQMLEGLVISPKIIGDRVGLHPLTIIVSIMIGTTLFGGVTGGVLAIPLTAALRTLMFRYVWRRREWDEFGNPLIDAELSSEEAIET